jgi:hypothetical protein
LNNDEKESMKMRSIKPPILSLLLFILVAAVGAADSRDGARHSKGGTAVGDPEKAQETGVSAAEQGQSKWQVVSSGGTEAYSPHFRTLGTLSQTAVGYGNSISYELSHGFWEKWDCRPGDPNGNVTINILDVTYLINYVYKGGPAPKPYAICSGDPNGNCVVNILDITYLINFVYKGGPAPVTCGQWLANCGPPLRY